LSNANAETIKDIKITIEDNANDEFRMGRSDLVVGMEVEHPKFGIGYITRFRQSGTSQVVEIDFERVGVKSLLVNFAKLRITDSSLNLSLQNLELSTNLDLDENNED
jgi:hypothetical protein